MKNAAALRKAARLISEPKAWTRNAFARNARGVTAIADSGEAVSWCAVGAAVACGAVAHGQLYSDLVGFNDDPKTKQEDVVMALLFEAELADD